MIRLIFLADFTESYAAKLVRGILKYTQDKEPWVICRMPPSYKQDNGIEAVVKWALRWGANAIIGQFNPDDNVDLFKKNGIVAIAQDYKSRFTQIPNITAEYNRMGYMAAELLAQKGFHNFAFYGYEDVIWSLEREEGFRGYLEEHGLTDHYSDYQRQPLDNLWFYESKPLEKWIHSLPKPVAMLACDDTRANKIIEVCHLIGIKVPEELAIIGVDNDELMCSLSFPSLTSISMAIEKGGYATAQLIEELVHNKEATTHDILVEPLGIVERQSTDIFATSNETIHKLLIYIHQHLSNPLSVEELVKQVPMSRRLLEKKFRQETGHSIYSYILDLRINRLSQLLISTNDPVSELTWQVGLTESKNLSRQFRKRKGMTPSEFRKTYKK
ncbi:MAG: DNA-binding transcriptional regulator [Massilibacteroides sp.]|nr:DNA-binding transcriptional regulator [Massilibacteroides sp.]